MEPSSRAKPRDLLSSSSAPVVVVEVGETCSPTVTTSPPATLLASERKRARLDYDLAPLRSGHCRTGSHSTLSLSGEPHRPKWSPREFDFRFPGVGSRKRSSCKLQRVDVFRCIKILRHLARTRRITSLFQEQPPWRRNLPPSPG
jgi:hypothetical protein